MKKICFLYIDEPYNIYHSLSIAIELHRTYRIQVSILCTERNHSIIDETLRDNNTTDLKVKIIRPFWHVTLPHYLEIKLQFRYFLFLRYKRMLSSFDGIVCALYNDLILKKYVNNLSTKLIYSRHGIANAPYSYDEKIKGFDYILIAGEKEEKRRKNLGQLEDLQYIVAGYVKYDICRNLESHNPFNNKKPIIFYNPHWIKEYSSFFDHGISILDQLSKQDEYNLIFAPHSLLTTRNPSIVPKVMVYQKYDNIHIDLGTRACHDMSYIKLSDYYLGDISSQALEFILHRERPCLYISNKPKLDSDYHFDSWEFGDVIINTSKIITQIINSAKQHEVIYSAIQRKVSKATFLQVEKTPSVIAANGIYNYLSQNGDIL